MKIGSLVEAQHSFDDVRRDWNLPYPYKGDILTISFIEPHPAPGCKKLNLLYFEELTSLPGVCDRQVNGQWNFLEIQPPMEINIEELQTELAKT